ncbi:MAG: type 2 isopentenyl-diphosphate Delta-isomerase [Chloroflexota bacterium]
MPKRPTDKGPTASRKAEHLAISTTQQVESSLGAGWEEVTLIHRSLPEVNRGEIELSTPLLGKRLQAPLVIAAMTGGTPQAEEINQRLARAANRFGLGIGVGSQRAYLENHEMASSYAVVRQEAPEALVIANIGAPQLIPQGEKRAYSPADARRAAQIISADALAVHLNYLQEAVQPEGDTRATGCADAIARLVQELELPVLAKETGAGVSREQALLLRELGVAALDVGGAGGTSFALIESYRAASRGDLRLQKLGLLFADWGIPTAVSVLECASSGLPLVATGGVRTGIDAARALALGATAVGVALPLLQPAMESYERVEQWVEGFLEELRTAMFLVGASDVAELRSREVVLFGRVREWVEQRGLGRQG